MPRNERIRLRTNPDRVRYVHQGTRVLWVCPRCQNAKPVDAFGWRQYRPGVYIEQSWCRECRAHGKKGDVPPGQGNFWNLWEVTIATDPLILYRMGDL